MSTCITILAVTFLLGSVPMSYLAYTENVKEGDERKLSIFNMLSLTSLIESQPYLYEFALIQTAIISLISYFNMYMFASKMSAFDFTQE